MKTEHKKAVGDFFDQWATCYTERFYQEKAPDLKTYILTTRRATALQMLVGIQGKGLDLGCGSGVIDQELLARGNEVWAIDISPRMIEQARLAVKPYEARAHFSVGDVEKLDFPDKFFDFVVCLGVLDYLSADKPTLLEIYRVLKPQGILVVSVPNKLGLAHLPRELLTPPLRILKQMGLFLPSLKDKLIYQSFRVRRFLPGQFDKTLKISGFSKLAHRYHGFALFPFDILCPFFSFRLSKAIDRLKTNPVVFLGSSYIVKASKEPKA